MNTSHNNSSCTTAPMVMPMAAPASVRGRMRPKNGAQASAKKKAKAAAKAMTANDEQKKTSKITDSLKHSAPVKKIQTAEKAPKAPKVAASKDKSKAQYAPRVQVASATNISESKVRASCTTSVAYSTAVEANVLKQTPCATRDAQVDAHKQMSRVARGTEAAKKSASATQKKKPAKVAKPVKAAKPTKAAKSAKAASAEQSPKPHLELISNASAKQSAKAKAATKATHTVKATASKTEKAPKAKASAKKGHFKICAVAAITLAVIVGGGALIYPVAKSYYVAQREYEYVEAEYQLVSERNAKLQARVNSLQTDEGIENEARSKYGYVYEGDQGIVVTGLPESESDIPDSVESSDVQIEETTVTTILDFFFGV